jgi:hypothetical protein
VEEEEVFDTPRACRVTLPTTGALVSSMNGRGEGTGTGYPSSKTPDSFRAYVEPGVS